MRKEIKIELQETLIELTNQVSDIFIQIKSLRQSVKDKTQIIEETKKLENLFNSFSNIEVSENKLFSDFNIKINSFSNATNLNKSRQLSRGKINFFDSVYNNPTYYGEIESNLSKIKNICEVSWYGILQAYGKVIISTL